MSYLSVADFSTSGVSGWEEKIFENKTSYQLVELENKKALKAESKGSASGLIKKLHVDLKKYPYLNWSWRIENRLNTGNEKITYMSSGINVIEGYKADTLVNLYKEVAEKSEEEHKLPMVAIKMKNQEGWLVVVQPKLIPSISKHIANADEPNLT